ncbi:phage holin family protein [Massilia sp. P8910]|uniref:phage holin family protein n=1 Tax=Massilia antarctica TaxID=2765360 RepID=UPI0006BB6471|nr:MULTISPECIES: phage holin family protein [Massilia]MCE3602936.1 phage holin family protein [Massilia antarctica]MCY0915534.1 phage holin family protein [Massilia sp. H27-R4]CUI04115.1 Probable transmembrane protein [Janthinobacterium sp. CG23_2]CUU27901.1 Probable transmembrane protein [Janthinobacterium sp. CG23_2]
MDKTTAAVHGPGLMGGLTGLAKNIFGLLVSRVELAALELSEVRNHVLELLVVFSLAVLCAMFALAYGTATIVALAWESMGWKILLLMFAVFIAVTIVLVVKAKAMLKEGKLAFPETMNELKNDRDMLL